MTVPERCEQFVTIGIDAAVVADHQIAIRGPGIREDFRASPTLAGMAWLTERLAPYAGSLVVVEPTAGTWLPLTMAVPEAGCRIGFVQNRGSAQHRKAITGRNKTDVIDADMLAAALGSCVATSRPRTDEASDGGGREGRQSRSSRAWQWVRRHRQRAQGKRSVSPSTSPRSSHCVPRSATRSSPSRFPCEPRSSDEVRRLRCSGRSDGSPLLCRRQASR